MNDGERFARALSSIARRVSKLQTTEVCCGGLTREQFETLRLIETAGGVSMSALSAALRVDASTMSRNISVLERERYVTRARATEDSRVVTVALTARGRKALETLRCDEQDVMARVFRRLPAANRRAIVDALESVQAALTLAPPAVSDAPCCPTPAASRATR
ncbi:MAG TPA: MarR family winged helix-turn-helix transcriptional regulator [Polyangia bacterium]|nr:MarR family winged helix-turn-helix transcriptional regulator [Polyangia bacterium]